MNPKNTPVARPDLDVALFNFADEWTQDPERALYRLQCLLLDEDTCLARVAFLRRLTAASGGPARARAVRPEEITLVCEEGLFAAHAAGRLTPDRIHLLDLLTRNPEALWR